jgi:DNA-binding Lrp family transcriptional regulator
MPKRSKKQIQSDETIILKELGKNANKSINEIAKKCGFSRQKVWRIIKRLEKNNTIWGYVTIIDDEKLDFHSYIILIKKTSRPLNNELLENITKRKIENNAKKLGITVESSYYVNGAYDYVICFNAEDIKQAKKLCENVNIIFEGYIEEIKLLENMFPIKKCGIVNPEIEKLKDFIKF